MKKIELNFNHRLYSELQIRYNRILEIHGYPGGILPPLRPPSPPPPGGSAKPNLADPGFVIEYIKKSKVVCPPAEDTVFENSYEDPDIFWYSAGLGATGAPSCMLLHEQIWTNLDENASGWDIKIFDYEGNFVKNAYKLEPAQWPQCVKKIRDKIWFSYTSSNESASVGFYTIPWDETLQSYPVDTANLIYEMPYNWKVVERKVDGKIFLGGLDGDCWAAPPPDPHSIFYYNQSENVVFKVVEIGGYSCGFAFDAEGNLWAGEYLLGWDDHMHILPCRLGMWTKADIDAVIMGQPYLTWDEASIIIELGTHPDPEIDLNWGVSDVEADDKGNIYVSLNTYEQFDNNHEYGAVIRVYKDEGGVYQKEYLLLKDNKGNNNWNWFRSLAFDGSNLFLDIDHNQLDPNSDDALVVVATI